MAMHNVVLARSITTLSTTCKLGVFMCFMWL